jgi:hypothetical protein
LLTKAQRQSDARVVYYLATLRYHPTRKVLGS